MDLLTPQMQEWVHWYNNWEEMMIIPKKFDLWLLNHLKNSKRSD